MTEKEGKKWFIYFTEKIRNNENIIKNKYKQEIKFIKRMFDLQHEIVGKYNMFLMSNLGAFNEKSKILLSAYYKNILTIYSAIELSTKGLYGSARILFRYIFEFLMIAKYCSISDDKRLLQRWENNEDIFLSKDVFDKISYPNNTSGFRFLWKALCKDTHPTIYSQQVMFEWSDEEIKLNLLLIRILLECNYHLLNSYLLNPSMRYYSSLYGNKKHCKALGREMKYLMKFSKNDMSNYSKKLICEYKSKWKLFN